MPAAPNSPAILRLIDFIGERVPNFLVRHPVLPAAGVGIVLGAKNQRGPENVLEGSLMAEQLGVSGSKYGGDELSQFVTRKSFISTKLAFEKVADMDWGGMAGRGFFEGAGKETARTSIGAIRQAISAISDAIKEKFYTGPARNQLLQDIVKNDPIVSTFEQEQPGGAERAFATMQRFAPELSTDKHIVTAFLRNAAMSGGALDHIMIKGIADAEAAVHNARNQGAWYPGGSLK